MYRIAYEGGGPVPAELQGSYTSQAKAYAALSIHKLRMAARTPEEKPDSEKTITELLATSRPVGRPPNAGKRN